MASCPTVEGWEPSFVDRQGTRAFVSHGARDPVIGVEFAQRARELLEAGGLDVTYRESELGHQIDPTHLRDAQAWLDEVLAEDQSSLRVPPRWTLSSMRQEAGVLAACRSIANSRAAMRLRHRLRAEAEVVVEDAGAVEVGVARSQAQAPFAAVQLRVDRDGGGGEGPVVDRQVDGVVAGIGGDFGRGVFDHAFFGRGFFFGFFAVFAFFGVDFAFFSSSFSASSPSSFSSSIRFFGR